MRKVVSNLKKLKNHKKKREIKEPLDKMLKRLTTKNENNIQQFFTEFFKIYPLIEQCYQIMTPHNPSYQKMPNSMPGNHLARVNTMDKMGEWFNEMDLMFDKILDNLPEEEANFRGAIRESKTFRPKENLKKWIDSLQEDGLLENFVNIRSQNKIKSEIWVGSLHSLSNLHRDPVKKTSDGKINVTWPILVESYIRDFEMIFQFLFRPLLQENGGFTNEYASDLKNFCKGVPQLHQELSKFIIKPYVRSLFAHQLYYYDYVKDKLIFFKINAESIEDYKELTLKEIKDLVFNINLFFWVFLLIAVEGSADKYKMHTIFEKLTNNQIEILQNHELYNKIKGIPLLKNNKQTLYDLLFPSNEITPRMQFFLYQTHQSGYILRMQLLKNIPPFEFGYDSVSRMSYLMGYAIMMERFLKPFMQANHPDLNIENLKDYQFIQEIRTYRNGEHFWILDGMDSEIRNSIAHISFFEKFPNFNYGKKKLKTNFTDIHSGQTLLYYQGILEMILDPTLKDLQLYITIAELLYQLLHKDSDKTTKYWEMAADTLSKYAHFKQIASICLLYCSFLISIQDPSKTQSKEIIEHINTAHTFVQNNEEHLSFVWDWIIKQIFEFNPVQNEYWVKLIFTHFRTIPNNPDMKQYINDFKRLTRQILNQKDKF